MRMFLFIQIQGYPQRIRLQRRPKTLKYDDPKIKFYDLAKKVTSLKLQETMNIGNQTV